MCFSEFQRTVSCQLAASSSFCGKLTAYRTSTLIANLVFKCVKKTNATSLLRPLELHYTEKSLV
jgi:hypothetical protein